MDGHLWTPEILCTATGRNQAPKETSYDRLPKDEISFACFSSVDTGGRHHTLHIAMLWRKPSKGHDIV